MLRAGLLLAALLPLAAAFVGQPIRSGFAHTKPSFMLRPTDVRAPRLRHSPRMSAAPPPRDPDDLLREAMELNADAEHNYARQQFQRIFSRRSAIRSGVFAGLGVAASFGAAGVSADAAVLRDSIPADPLGFGSDFNVAPGKKIVLPDGIVEKSEQDRRSYRALTLPNGLRVFLASDPKADQAAAALDVHVGHYSDPDEVPGLAHFCEHMLFLGTKKYPDEGSLDSFLSKNGGQNNAFTANEDTTYFFSINQNALEPALDIFSSFFVAPLFTASGVERELNAIEAEHTKNLQTDSWRMNQIGKLRYNQEHPVAKFGTGNKFTLKERTKEKGIDLRSTLLEWHDQYYSANMMTLAVCGKDDLDTLEKWVTAKFADVPNTNTPPAEAKWAGKIAPIENLKTAAKSTYSILPVQDDRSLSVEWILPYSNKEDRRARLQAKPQTVIGALLGHEGKGSLLSYLKNEKGLVTSLGAATFEESADYISFGLSVELTALGLEKKDDVLSAISDYLDMIRGDAIPEYIYKEIEQMAEIGFRFKETGSPLSFAIASGLMHKYSPAEYLTGPATYRGLNKKMVTSLLDQMTPDRALVTLVSRDVANQAPNEEYWYKAKYGISPSTSIKKRGEAALAGKLKIPSPNPFIPTQFALKSPATEQLSDPIAPPEMLLDSPSWRVHFKPDRRYGQPKGVAFFQISQPDEFFGGDNSARTSAYARLLKMYLTDFLREDTYAASEAGLGYACDFTAKGLRLEFAGFSDKLPDYVSSVTSKIASFVPNDESKIDRYKDIISRDLDSFVTQQPYQHANFFARQCTDNPSFLPLEVLVELKKISFTDLQGWARTLWNEGFGEALVQGNFEEKEALAMVQRVEDSFQFKPVPADQRAIPKLVELPVELTGYGQTLVLAEPNAAEVNSAVVVQFQNPSKDLRDQMAMQVISSVIDQPFFADLRTKQQLGYIVAASNKEQDGVRSLVFTVQSAVAEAASIVDKVFTFVDGFASTAIADLPQEAFEASVRGLIAKKLQTDKTLGDEAGRHWGEISAGQYKYDRQAQEVAVLRSLTRKHVQDVFARVVQEGGSERRPLTTMVYSKGRVPWERKRKGPDGTVLIADAKKFRASRPYVSREKASAPLLALRDAKKSEAA